MKLPPVDHTKCPLKDCLIDPFNDLVDRLDKEPVYNKAYVFTGVTGQGKTLAVTNNHIEKLLVEKDVDIIIYSAPFTEILEHDKFEDAARNADRSLPKNSNGVNFHSSDPLNALKSLKRGKKVVIETTHQGMWTKNAKLAKKLINYITENKLKVAVFIDEAHTWTVSDPLNYLLVTGNNGQNYEAALFKAVSKLAKFSPYIFGITATPNREHTGVVPVIGTKTYEIANEMAPKQLMVWKNSWYNDHTFFNPTNANSVKETLKSMMSKMSSDEKITGVKTTALLLARAVLSQRAIDAKEAKGESLWHADVETIMGYVKEINNEYNYFSNDEIVISTMTQDVLEGVSSDGSKLIEYDDEDDLKERLNSPTDPLRFVIAVEKGKAGMNVFSFNKVMSCRPYDGKSDELGEMTETPIQIMGRLVRLYSGMWNDDFVNEYGYDMKKYLEKNPNELEKIKILNSFDLYLPNTPVWKVGLEQFLDKYVTDVKDVDFGFLNPNGDFIPPTTLEEETPCPCCEKVDCQKWINYLTKSNKNDLDFTDIDKALNIAA